MALAEINGQVKLLTGSTEPAIKLWSVSPGNITMDMMRETQGPVEHIEVSGQTIMWSVEEHIPVCAPGTDSGVVYLLDQATGNTLPITVCFLLTPFAAPRRLLRISPPFSLSFSPSYFFLLPRYSLLSRGTTSHRRHLRTSNASIAS